MNAIQQAVMQQCAANGISDPAQITQLVGEAVKGAATQDVLQNGRYQSTNLFGYGIFIIDNKLYIY